MAQQKQIRLGNMRLCVPPLASLSEMRIQHCRGCSIGCRRSLDLTLPWLWCKLAAIAPIRPLAWEPPCVMGAAQEMAKSQKEIKIIKK